MMTTARGLLSLVVALFLAVPPAAGKDQGRLVQSASSATGNKDAGAVVGVPTVTAQNRTLSVVSRTP